MEIQTNIIYNMDCIEGLKDIPDQSVDCVITDPPYGLNWRGHLCTSGKLKPIINDDSFLLPMDELWRVLKPTGCMFIFYSHKIPFNDSRIKNIIIWVKNLASQGDLFGDFGNQYEPIAFIPKSEFKIKSKRYTNIWQFDRVSPDKLVHPTQKPLRLIERMVESATNKGDIVLDCFAGSGTTALACKNLSRRYICYEIDKDYCNLIESRLKQSVLIEFGI
jgi:site-specific DNA-methyltransferase (adenine-specific)